MFGKKSTPKYWVTPAGQIYTLFQDMASQPHLLIAGATGSGKSVLVNGIVYTLLHKSPAKAQFILIDPKRTELKKFSRLPHVLTYADTSDSMLQALQYAQRITDARFADMQKNGWTEYQGSDVFVFIDELAALMTTQKRDVLPILQYLGIIARAAHVHLVCCTQTVKATVLPTPLTCNFDARVAMRTATAQQSRMIIDQAGCELFPSPLAAHSAYCYYRTGADISKYVVPMHSKEEINAICNYWLSPACVA